MSDGQFWFVLTCLVILLDLLTWKQRRAIDNEARAFWAEHDAESQRRHEEWMASWSCVRCDLETGPMPTHPDAGKGE